MKRFSLAHLNDKSLEALASEYAQEGFCVLSDIGDDVAAYFEKSVAAIIDLDIQSIEKELRSDRVFSAEVRKRLSRVETEAGLKQLMLARFRSVLLKLIGPLVHVSSTFHSQFKNLSAKPVDHGGYDSGMDYMEVHGPYLLHQDFAGASFPTTPSMMIIWVPLNSSSHWNLRLYRGSHRLGLLCNTWMDLNHDRLNQIGEAVNIPAKRGEAVIFNALTLHGTSNPGPDPRISCDIRFFPLCGFLPTQVHFLSDDPVSEIQSALRNARMDVLQAPLLEDITYLIGRYRPLPPVPAAPHSVLNWVNYISARTRENPEEAVQSLMRLVNTEAGIDPPSVYIEKFHHHPVQWQTIESVQNHLDHGWREKLNGSLDRTEQGEA